MKKIFLFFILVLFIISCKKEEVKTESGITYTMYYFHPSARCESCINIENFAKELIETKFNKNPEIKFIALNIEDAQNQHFRKDYDLKFSSIILSKIKDSKEEKFKNLDSIWTYSSDKVGFIKYMNSEIKEFIK
jgi:hypothetical protein